MVEEENKKAARHFGLFGFHVMPPRVIPFDRA